MPHDQILDFNSAIWHCDYDGKLISFEGDVAFDSVLGSAHRRQGLHLHDVFLLCLKRPSARMAINEFDSVLTARDQNKVSVRKLQDIVLLDGTFARQNLIMRPLGGLSVIWTEISDIRSEAVKYRRQANHDPLTGLLNRRGFELGVGGHYRGSHSNKIATLLQIDLDNFKNVNDKFGHDSGDRVLIHTAECLRQVFGFGSLIARIGGDEFAVLHLQRDATFDLNAATSRLNRLVRENDFASGEATGLGVSVGAVHLGNRRDCSFQEVLNQADRELYASKKLGKAKAQLKTEPNAFEYHFQPILSATNHEIVGFEALIRRKKTDGALHDTDKFLPGLRESRALAEVERALFHEVLEAYVALKRKTGRDFEFSINISQQQWDDEAFPSWLIQTLRDAGVPESKIRIELLEDISLGAEDSAVRRNIAVLSRSDVKIDLDDFGLSGASLDRLALPGVGRVKIARHMLKGYWDQLPIRKIIDAILDLSASFEYPVVLEGIEEEWQLQSFASSQCAFVQGFLFSRPMPISHWLECDSLVNSLGNSSTDITPLALPA